MSTAQIRRINLFGGPGISKSTTAADIFSRLKRHGISINPSVTVELIQEYVKGWAWEGKKPQGWDQLYLFAKQLKREELPLRNGVSLVISDSPLLLNYAYAKLNQSSGWLQLSELVQEFERQYPSLNILLERGTRPYIQSGRFESEEQARFMDAYIRGVLDSSGLSYTTVPFDSVDTMMKLIYDVIP